MSETEKNWIGWGIDLVRLWQAKGGGLVFAAAFFGLFLSWVDGVPAFLAPALLIAALGGACVATFRTYRVLRIGGSGARLSGRIGGMEKNYVGDENRHSRVRALFSYEIEGQQYEGHTSWAPPRMHKKRFGVLEPGNLIDLTVDPARPDKPIPLAEVPNLGWAVR